MYNIIYADPPYHYNNRRLIRKDGRKASFGIGAAGRYPVMKTEDICKIPVAGQTADNCALFLWTTFPRYDAGLEIMKAWGFDYKSIGFLWIKLNPKRAQTMVPWGIFPIEVMNWLSFFGIGYYTKSNPEACLLGIKGRMKPISNSISNLVYAPIEKHSKKPNIIRDKIVELFGDLPRVELFARETTDGWDTIGLDIDGKDIREGFKLTT